MIENIKVFVIVVTYNGKIWIEKCLRSLKESLLPVEIIVIDNGSSDGTQEVIKQFTEIHFIQSETNLGFGKANNKGMQIALDNDADYIFLLNQDAWVEKNTIPELVKLAKNNPDYGVISPLHLNGTSTALDLNCSYHLIPEKCPGFYSDLYFSKLKDLYEIEFVNAAAWLLPVGCIKKTGVFEPMFFLYGEDNNYLQRVTYHGFKIGITPRCTICHDRESRKGEFNSEGRLIYTRTESLILLLNILNSYAHCIFYFMKAKIFQSIKYLFRGKFLAIKSPLAELLFFIRNFRKIKNLRNSYKGNINQAK